MELITKYISSSPSESSDDKLKPAKVRSVYLVTYSQADLSIFPDRQSFADAVLKCEGPKSKVIQWTTFLPGCTQPKKINILSSLLAIRIKQTQVRLEQWPLVKRERIDGNRSLMFMTLQQIPQVTEKARERGRGGGGGQRKCT